MSVEVHTDATKAKMRAAWVRRRAALPSFWERLDVGDCWLWTGAVSSTGYGDVTIEGRHWLTHRYAYEQLVGPIPTGLTLDHLCRERTCVNPDHLEPVTMGENGRRGYSPWARNAAKTKCVRGHVFDASNTRITKQGYRDCRECGRANWRRWNARKQREYLSGLA